MWKEHGIRNWKGLRPGLVTSCVTLDKDLSSELEFQGKDSCLSKG